MINELAFERENKRKANLVSTVFHILLLLLAFFATCNYEKAADNQYAVALNFEEIVPPKLEEFKESSQSNKAQEKEGKPRKNADRPAEIKDQQTKTVETKRPEVKLPKPTPTPPKPTDPVVSETTMEEETEVSAAEEILEIEDPEPEAIPEPDPVPEPIEEIEEPEPPAPEPAKESVKTKIGKLLDVIKAGGSDDDGNPDGDPSRSDGTADGTGEGNKGDGAGRDASGNDGDSGSGDGGAGVGEYDGSGNGVFGRRVIYRNIAEILRVGFGNQEGKRIVAKFCVNRDGIVTYAELLNFETNAIIPPGKEKAVLKGIYGYKVEADPKAPKEQCGKLKILLNNINTFGG